MSGLLYDIVLIGAGSGKQEFDNPEEGLRRLFRLDEAGIEKLLRACPVTIKRNVVPETAAEIVKALEAVGAEYRIEPATPARVVEPPSTDPQATPGAEAPGPSGSIRCPKCAHVQSPSAECVRCGIVFEKFNESMEEASKPGAGSSSVVFYDLADRRRKLCLLLLLTAVFGYLAFDLWTSRDIRTSPGILAASEPKQVMVKNPKAWKIGDKTIVPMAAFRVKARVLGRERYRLDAGADLCPMDLALGWGPMSDQQVLDRLEIGQGSRRYAIMPLDNPPVLPMPVIMSHSSNMHIIPANDEVKRALLRVRNGQVVDVEGYLVGVRQGGRWTWVTSLSRTDTGDGACEIVWAERFVVIP